jgi:hypothetical protein
MVLQYVVNQICKWLNYMKDSSENTDDVVKERRQDPEMYFVRTMTELKKRQTRLNNTLPDQVVSRAGSRDSVRVWRMA